MKRHQRTPLTCPICHRVTKYLSTHLRRVCMRSESNSEIKTNLAIVKDRLRLVAAKGTSIAFSELKPLQSLDDTVAFVESRGYFIVNKPTFQLDHILLTFEGQTQAPTDYLPPCYVPPVDSDSHMMDPLVPEQSPDHFEGAPSPESDPFEAMDGSTQNIQSRRWINEISLARTDAGLYRRHSVNSPMLKSFRTYLTVTRGVPNCNQEVSNVARFLFFINPRFISLEYLNKPAKVNDFFKKLSSLKLSNQTSLKILKHIRRFTTYQMRGTQLSIENPQLYRACEVFMSFTEDLRKTLYRGVCQDSVSKRYDTLMKPSKTPNDCQKILNEARPTFLACIENVQEGGSEEDRREVIMYLQALLILRHLQRPGVVRNLTVSEWNGRTYHMYRGVRKTIVGVKTHKCASTQVASFVLSEEEHSWFKVYAEHIRPVIAAGREIANFFLTCTGKVVRNPSAALRRYHESYSLPHVTSHFARRVCETWTLSRYSDSERHLFARYLAHTNGMAEKVYREKTLGDMCLAHELVINSGQAVGDDSQADGDDSQADGDDWWADGGDSQADGADRLADGGDSQADGADRLADGGDSQADGANRLADGGDSQADGADRLADGADRLADGGDSQADGADRLADGNDSQADGADRRADGDDSQPPVLASTSHSENQQADNMEIMRPIAKPFERLGLTTIRLIPIRCTKPV